MDSLATCGNFSAEHSMSYQPHQVHNQPCEFEHIVNSNGGRLLAACIALCKQEHKACLKHHPDCKSKFGKGQLPTRVIDVGPPDGSKPPYFFVPTAPNEKKPRKSLLHGIFNPSASKTRYTTLSYCWGKPPHFTTTMSNLTSMTKHIPWDKLPQTIKDAITLTRKLGIRYLWVDALCIIQGSAEDWQTESAKMGQVYGGSFLTISAVSGKDIHYGLTQTATTTVLGPNPHFLLQDPLYTRAWALQERVLSTRLLIFGSDKLHWECNGKQQSEDGLKLMTSLYYRLKSYPTALSWQLIVEDYMSRSLTQEMDKLPALSGLAAAYQSITGYDYMMGLWKQSLLEDLM